MDFWASLILSSLVLLSRAHSWLPQALVSFEEVTVSAAWEVVLFVAGTRLLQPFIYGLKLSNLLG